MSNEPVAWMDKNGAPSAIKNDLYTIPLYTSLKLTDLEIVQIRNQQAEIEELEAELFVKDAFLKTSICLSKAELESGLTRVQWAEALIKQLPEEHEGRNSWLLNYGKKK
jgi:hypothetical protein